jgi:hypothetical protein
VVEGLLTEAAGLLRARRGHREATGEGYNFFTALCAHHDENRHSRFLHSLLNPRGAHGQGARFLRLFLTELGIVPDTDGRAWRLDLWRVETEVTFPDGRRIDLLLDGPEAVIGTENKVLSGEGRAQLRDYAHSLAVRSGARPATLVFLTPSGRDPEAGAEPVTRMGVALVCCGYGHQASPSLFHWLAACRQVVADKPGLDAVVQQYSNLADRIGGNTMGTQDRLALAALLQRRDHFEAATALVEALTEAKIQAQVAFWQALKLPLSIWPEAGRAAPDTALVRCYYGTARDRPLPGRVYDTGLRWREHALVLVLELLPDKGRPYLTCKFQLRGAAAPDKAVHLPGDEDLSRRLCAQAPNLKRSSASLATGDLLLPDGTPLDVTDFKRGWALAWLDPATRPQVLDEVAQAVASLVARATNQLATLQSR